MITSAARRILLSIASAALCGAASAAPAWPEPVTMRQSDGTAITVTLHGDEFLHYATDSSGACVIQQDGDWFYADIYDGALVSTGVRVGTTRSGAPSRLMSGSGFSALRSYATQARRRTAALRKTAAPSMAAATRAAQGSAVTVRMPIILVEFADNRFSGSDPNKMFSDMMNLTGYSYNGATGSVAEYYSDNTQGRLRLQFDVYGPYKLSNRMSYYGKNFTGTNVQDANVPDMVVEACRAADRDVNFAQYSSNGKYVDNIYIFFAGYNEAEGAGVETIWPHTYFVTDGTRLDGVELYSYGCSSELKGSSGTVMTGIGTFCHEMGHILGLPDFYDTEYTGAAVDLKHLSLMGSGNYNNSGRTPPALSAMERNIIAEYLTGTGDWAEVTRLSSEGVKTLAPLYEGKAMRLDTSNPDEYFILENRSRANRWDKHIISSPESGVISHDGMAVYHVDQSQNIVDIFGTTAAETWVNNTIMTPYHECYRIVRPNGSSEISQWFYPGASGTSTLAGSSVKDFIPWGKTSYPYVLQSIARSGQDIRFTLSYSGSMDVFGQVFDMTGMLLPGATVFMYPLNEYGVRAATADTPSLSALVREATRAPKDEIRTVSGADGTFSVKGIAAGKYEIYVSLKGYNDYRSIVNVSPELTDIMAQLNRIDFTGVSTYTTPYKGLTHTSQISGTGVSVAASHTGAELGAVQGGESVMLTGIDFILGARCSGKVSVTVADYQGRTVSERTLDYSAPAAGRVFVDTSAANISVGYSDRVTVAVTLDGYNCDMNLYADSSIQKEWGMYSTNGGKNWQYMSIGDGTYGAWPIGLFATRSKAASGISILDSAVSLSAGTHHKIRYSVSPEGASTRVTWSSSRPEVADVDSSGVIRALRSGSASVTATLPNGTTARLSVSVTDDEITSISDVKLSSNGGKADVSWTSELSGQTWIVRYRAGDGPWMTVKTSGTSATLSGLQAASEYTVEISRPREYMPQEYWTGWRTTFRTVGIAAAALQREAMISWGAPQSDTKWTLTLSEAVGGKELRSVECTAPSAYLADLEPGTSYRVTVRSESGDMSAIFTTDRIAARYAHISLPSGTLSADTEIPLELRDLQEAPKEVQWSVDGVSLKRAGLTVSLKAGSHTVKAKAVMKDGSTETVTKKVTVK